MTNSNRYLLFFFLLISLSIASCISDTKLTKKEKKYLSNNPDIVVGIYITYPPFVFIDNTGKIDGIIIDYFSKLESNINHTFKKKYYSNWQFLMEDTKNKKVDIILEIQDTPDRRNYLTFTKPVFVGRHIILTKNTNKQLTIEDLSGKRVSVGENYSIEEFLTKNYPQVILVPKPNEETCISALVNDEVEAFVGLEAVTKHIIAKQGYNNLKIQGSVHYDNEVSFAINNEKPILASIIKKGNNSITIEEKNEILNKWLYDIARPFDEKLPFWKKLFAALAILSIISFMLSIYLKSQIKKRSIELIKAKQNAEKSNALKTLFLQNISHEVRTPLNSIIGFASFLKEEKNEEIKNEYINTILNESSNLSNILNNVIEISELTNKKTSPKSQPVDLNKEFHFIEEVYRAKATTKGLDFVFNNSIKPKESYILSDKIRLNKSINNILDNAIKFTTNGSIIFDANIENGLLKITIKDTGIGIDASELKSIFSEFYQEEKELSKKYDGLGIGLSISKENIESLGGKIIPFTNKGKGSMFTIELPVKFSYNDSKSEAIEVQNNLRILIAEDMKLNYLVLQKILNKIITYNKEIVWAKNGQEAVNLVKLSDFDIIFMDIKMPLLSGYEATKLIKGIKPNIIIIAQTSYAHGEDIEKAESIGFDAYITKPIDSNALKIILEDFFIKKS